MHYQLSKYTAPIISPLASKTNLHVLNSKHFAETMRHVTTVSDESLVSFDVTSLFINVPIGEAVEIIGGKLREGEDLFERTPLLPDRVAGLLSLCLLQPVLISATVVNFQTLSACAAGLR